MATRKRRDDLEAAAFLNSFWMPSVQTMVSRKSSITNAFVNSLLPTIQPTVQEIQQALTILKMSPTDLRCSYCGDKATEWDHLRPIVEGLRPTGYFSEIANLVPSCNKCNQSKRNASWKTWMMSGAKRSPTGRGVSNVPELMARLEAYELWKSPTKIDFEEALGPKAYATYWSMWDRINAELRECQKFADSLRVRVLESLATRSTVS